MGIYDLDLQELPLFEGLKADEVEQFIQATEAKVKRYGKEVRILKAYEANSRIGIIVEGRRSSSRRTASAMRLSATGWSAGAVWLDDGHPAGVRESDGHRGRLGCPRALGAVHGAHRSWPEARPHPRHRHAQPAQGLLPQECPDDAEARGALAEERCASG